MSERVIRVQPSELLTAANNVRGYRGTYINDYNDIVSKANSLTSTSWGGSDAEAFAKQVNTFKNTFSQMETILQEYITFLENSAETYKTALQNATTEANNLKSKV